MNEDQINNQINKVLNQNYTSGSPQIPPHTHNGIDSLQISAASLLGFPIMATAPTDQPANGTIRLYDVSGTRKLYAFISGVWYSTTLT